MFGCVRRKKRARLYTAVCTKYVYEVYDENETECPGFPRRILQYTSRAHQKPHFATLSTSISPHRARTASIFVTDQRLVLCSKVPTPHTPHTHTLHPLPPTLHPQLSPPAPTQLILVVLHLLHVCLASRHMPNQHIVVPFDIVSRPDDVGSRVRNAQRGV